MKDIMEYIKSPAWWFSVVVVGLVLNIVSGYLRVFLESRVTNTGAWFNRFSKEKQQIFEGYVATILDNRDEEMRVSFMQLRLMAKAILMAICFALMFACSLLLMTVGSKTLILTGILGVLFFIVSEFCYLDATYWGRVLNAANAKRSEKASPLVAST
jgi:hypothetical protein